MRCRACNVNLTDFESTRKSASSGDYLDMCNRCLGYIVADMDTDDNFENFDSDLDEHNMSAIVPTGDELSSEGDLGAGPDSDEPEDDGFHPADGE